MELTNQSMSQLSDAELRQPARGSARSGILFGAFFVALGGVLMIVAQGISGSRWGGSGLDRKSSSPV